MTELFTLVRNGADGVISVGNPPVNALSPGVPEGIVDPVEAAKRGPGGQRHGADRRRARVHLLVPVVTPVSDSV